MNFEDTIEDLQRAFKATGGLTVLKEIEAFVRWQNNRINLLESYLEKSADGKILEECDKLYCPECKKEVKQDIGLCYCWNCSNPDNFNDIPLPLLYTLCYSDPKNIK